MPGYSAVETDHPNDLLLSGTEIPGGCQDIYNSLIYWSHGLASYLMDGKYRILAIKDQNGKLIARRMIKILWDKKQESPVLFFEKFYGPKEGKGEQFDAILESMAREKAASMKLPLVRKVEGKYKSDYPNSIHSLGGPGPEEFVDTTRNALIPSTKFPKPAIW